MRKLQVRMLNRPTPGEVSSRGLALLFAVEMRRLGEIGVGVLHELGLGLRVTEAIGLALDGCIDRAIGQHLFAVGKAPAALIVELTGERRRGEAERKRAGERRRHDSLDHGAFSLGLRPYLGSGDTGSP